LDHVVQIKLKMTIAASQVEDTSARSLIRQIADINGKMLFVWEDIRQAFMDGDNEALRRAGMKAQGLAQEKITVAGPILRRLREKVGDKAVDGAMERELREVARKAGL
jgi:L-2-hydroxyglutarate oxidase LhgO